jgi:hypothetical protein
VSLEYQTHASRLHEKAKQEHQTWLKSLTADQLENLRRLGVLDAPDDSHEVGGHSPAQVSDLADTSLVGFTPDLAGEIDGMAEILADELGIDESVARKFLAWHEKTLAETLRTREADLLSIVVGGLLAAKNISIAAGSLAFAANMAAANGLGCPAEYARRLGVSRTILSKAILAWKRQFGLLPSPYQKTEEACATYSEVARKKHWRKAKVSASALAKRLHTILKKS